MSAKRYENSAAIRRSRRVRSRVKSTGRLRLSVFRSARHIYARSSMMPRVKPWQLHPVSIKRLLAAEIVMRQKQLASYLVIVHPRLALIKSLLIVVLFLTTVV